MAERAPEVPEIAATHFADLIRRHQAMVFSLQHRAALSRRLRRSRGIGAGRLRPTAQKPSRT